jgi:hypothetical protein
LAGRTAAKLTSFSRNFKAFHRAIPRPRARGSDNERAHPRHRPGRAWRHRRVGRKRPDLWIEDTPSTTEANGRTATNAPLLAGILARAHARVAFCEFVGARPTDAKVAAFSFGRARGVIEGVCGALSIPIVFITPPVWKRLADIPPGVEHKDLARTRAIAKWPGRAE